MTDPEDSNEKLRIQLEEIMTDHERAVRADRVKRADESQGWTSVELSRKIREEKWSPTITLSTQALNAKEIREELEEAVNSLSTEEFSAWALERLSPYTTADVLAEAHLSVVKHNVKVLLRMAKGNG